MNARATIFFAFVLGLFALAGFSQAAQARVQTIDHGGVYFDDVYIESGQIVDGDITVIGATATVEGTVRGDLTVLGGNVVERPGSIISGRINDFGGEVVRSIVPWSQPPVETSVVGDARVLWKIGWSAIVVLIFLIFPMRTRMALDRMEKHPGLCAAVGTIGWIAIIPIALLLCVTVVLIPLVFVEAIAVIAGVFVGKAAVALLVGRRLYEMVSPRSTPSPLFALVLGLALITAAEIVPIVGWMVSALIGLVGLGAAILSFVREESFTGVRPVAPAGPSIGGPPMVIG